MCSVGILASRLETPAMWHHVCPDRCDARTPLSRSQSRCLNVLADRPCIAGKRDVKVKALEAAEAAKRLAEQKELEKQERKRAAEIAKRDKQERAALEKMAKREKAAQDKLMKQQEARAEKEKENEEASRRRAAAAGTAKSVLTDSSNCQGTSGQNVLLKVSPLSWYFDIGSAGYRWPAITTTCRFSLGFGCRSRRLTAAML